MPTSKRVRGAERSANKLAKLLEPKKSMYVSAAELRHNSAEVVSRVAIGGERLVLTRNRKPVAALVPMEDFKTLGKTGKRRAQPKRQT